MSQETAGKLSVLYSDQKVTFDILMEKTRNANLRDALEKAKKLSPLPDPILILGETGVGKNMVAQAVHNEKRRKGFHEVTCSGISEKLFESEFFGYKKGAFTGALADRDGLAKSADGGTLFLDEIGELSLALQVKLLRLIEQKCFYPVGGDSKVTADIHIICATNKSVQGLRDAKIFRRDLFYRMPLIVRIPSLRERPEDISDLINYFFDLFSREANVSELTMRADTLEILQMYSWPGNVRELKFAIKLAFFSAIGEKEIKPSHLPEWVKIENEGLTSDLSLQAVEKKHILYVYDLAGGNITKTAKILNIGRTTLYRRLQEYNVVSELEKNVDEANM